MVATEMVTVASWNVNSIRPRLEHLGAWLAERRPDAVLLQETKVEDKDFPREAIEDMGYNIAIFGQKTYNGVAILSKGRIEDVACGFDGAGDQARYIEAITTISGQTIRLASVYVPNGQEVGSEKFAYKMDFMAHLREHLQKLISYEEAIVVGGDFNVAPETADVHEPSAWEGQILCHPQERAAFRSLLHMGFSDGWRLANPNDHDYSWWDYRAGAWAKNNGLRIDHLLLSPEAADILSEAAIDRNTRGWDKPSDHAPVWCSLDAA